MKAWLCGFMLFCTALAQAESITVLPALHTPKHITIVGNRALCGGERRNFVAEREGGILRIFGSRALPCVAGLYEEGFQLQERCTSPQGCEQPIQSIELRIPENETCLTQLSPPRIPACMRDAPIVSIERITQMTRVYVNPALHSNYRRLNSALEPFGSLAITRDGGLISAVLDSGDGSPLRILRGRNEEFSVLEDESSQRYMLYQSFAASIALFTSTELLGFLQQSPQGQTVYEMSPLGGTDLFIDPRRLPGKFRLQDPHSPIRSFTLGACILTDQRGRITAIDCPISGLDDPAAGQLLCRRPIGFDTLCTLTINSENGSILRTLGDDNFSYDAWYENDGVDPARCCAQIWRAFAVRIGS